MIADASYEDRFEEARTPEEKWAVLKEFLQRYPDLVGHSEWFKAEVARQFIEPAVEREPDLNIELFQRRRPAAPASPTEPVEGKLSAAERQGKFCDQVIVELRRIKQFFLRGWTVHQVMTDSFVPPTSSPWARGKHCAQFCAPSRSEVVILRTKAGTAECRL